MGLARLTTHRIGGGGCACSRTRSGILIVVVFLFSTLSQSLASDAKSFSISFKGSLTTGSQLFPHPNSADEAQRAEFFSIKEILGYGIEVRYRFPETELAIALSADYLRATESSSIRLSGKQIPLDDGYRVLPVELTGYFLIPISGDVIGVYMGGGAGAYFGRRIYRIGNTEAPSIDQGVGVGIHVLSGVSYRFSNVVSVNAEMKFRDLQFNSTNQFPASKIQYGTTSVDVPTTKPFESRVHTDGIVFQVGVVVDF
jgi:hypothetical protein